MLTLRVNNDALTRDGGMDCIQIPPIKLTALSACRRRLLPDD